MKKLILILTLILFVGFNLQSQPSLQERGETMYSIAELISAKSNGEIFKIDYIEKDNMWAAHIMTDLMDHKRCQLIVSMEFVLLGAETREWKMERFQESATHFTYKDTMFFVIIKTYDDYTLISIGE